jgi:hypothetical protein
LAAVGCAALGLSAHAQEFSLGAGAGIDRGKTDCVATYACDHGSAHTKLFAGYRFGDGLELHRGARTQATGVGEWRPGVEGHAAMSAGSRTRTRGRR